MCHVYGTLVARGNISNIKVVMELVGKVLFWIYILVEFVSGSIQTVSSLDVILHHTPALTCTYTYDMGNPDWIFIRWYKMNGTESIPLAFMQRNSDPSWLETAPEEIKNHTTLMDSSTDNSVSFDIRIDDFLCSDEGTYKCEVFTLLKTLMSTTELHAAAHPGPPRIHDDLIQVKENDSFSIHCHANIGIPPIELRWSYKPKDINAYTLITKGVRQENSQAKDCTFKGTSSLTVVMSEELDGAHFLCATSGEIGHDGNPRNFDEVELQLHRTTTTTLPTTTTACDGKNGKSCDQAQAVIDDGKNSANAYQQSLLTVSLIAIVVSRTVFSS